MADTVEVGRLRLDSDDNGPLPELPDLSDRLRASGVYDEYRKFRANYLKWRKGEGRGAEGELSSLSMQTLTLSSHLDCAASGLGASIRTVHGASTVSSIRRPSVHDFSLWFPTPQKFKFFYTNAFWVAITCLTGSFLLFFTSTVNWIGIPYEEDCLVWVELMVSVLFLVSTYLGYLDLINLQSERRVFIWPTDWTKTLTHARYWESVVGVVSFFVAMILWIIPSAIATLPTSWQPASYGAKLVWVKLPDFIGGFGFFLGGMCECLHNRHAESIFEPVVWVAICNLVGGLNFFLSCAATIGAEPSNAAVAFGHFNLWMGAICYCLGGMLLIVMWRANDFGLCLMNQLNNAAKSGHGVEIGAQGEGLTMRLRHTLTGNLPTALIAASEVARDGQHLSIRGVSFLVCYCFLFSVSYVNCVNVYAYGESDLRHFTDFAMAFIWILTVIIVLVVHSAVTNAPNQQPYRMAMFSMRFILFCATVVQSVVLFSSMSDLHDFGHRRHFPDAFETTV